MAKSELHTIKIYHIHMRTSVTERKGHKVYVIFISNSMKLLDRGENSIHLIGVLGGD